MTITRSPSEGTTSTQPAPDRRRFALLAIGGSVLLGASLLRQGKAVSAEEEAVVIAPPLQDVPPGSSSEEKAILAGGCFWGVQGVYQHLKGVLSATSGYSGGAAGTASYEAVSSGRTGHAESVAIIYDPAQVSYGTLLQIFFSVVHDPTQLDRQGPDVGPQYRSAIFAATDAQARVARAYVDQLDAEHVFKRPIVTRIEDKPSFFPAEAYHQDFLVEHPDHPYIVFNDLPKVAALRKHFPDRYRAEPVLVKRTPA